MKIQVQDGEQFTVVVNGKEMRLTMHGTAVTVLPTSTPVAVEAKPVEHRLIVGQTVYVYDAQVDDPLEMEDDEFVEYLVADLRGDEVLLRDADEHCYVTQQDKIHRKLGVSHKLIKQEDLRVVTLKEWQEESYPAGVKDRPRKGDTIRIVRAGVPSFLGVVLEGYTEGRRVVPVRVDRAGAVYLEPPLHWLVEVSKMRRSTEEDWYTNVIYCTKVKPKRKAVPAVGDKVGIEYEDGAGVLCTIESIEGNRVIMRSNTGKTNYGTYLRFLVPAGVRDWNVESSQIDEVGEAKKLHWTLEPPKVGDSVTVYYFIAGDTIRYTISAVQEDTVTLKHPHHSRQVKRSDLVKKAPGRWRTRSEHLRVEEQTKAEPIGDKRELPAPRSLRPEAGDNVKMIGRQEGELRCVVVQNVDHNVIIQDDMGRKYNAFESRFTLSPREAWCIESKWASNVVSFCSEL